MSSRYLATLFIASSLLGCGAASMAPAAEPKETTDATELFQRGQQAAAQGDSVRAEQYLSMAIDQGFEQKKVLPIMLRVCLSSNRVRAALNHAEPYLREHPEDQGLRYLVATLHLSLGQVEQTRIDLNHLLRVNPKYANAHYLLGVLETAGARNSRASEHFRAYLELAPEGEHAAEVKSRLMDLAVRTDMDFVAASRDESHALETIVIRRSKSPSNAAEGSSSAAWFESAAATINDSQNTGEHP